MTSLEKLIKRIVKKHCCNCNFTNLVSKNYPDNAAALTNGLAVGQVYHTNGTLKIVI